MTYQWCLKLSCWQPQLMTPCFRWCLSLCRRAGVHVYPYMPSSTHTMTFATHCRSLTITCSPTTVSWSYRMGSVHVCWRWRTRVTLASFARKNAAAQSCGSRASTQPSNVTVWCEWCRASHFVQLHYLFNTMHHVPVTRWQLTFSARSNGHVLINSTSLCSLTQHAKRPEVATSDTVTSSSVIFVLTDLFCRHGQPDRLQNF